MAAAGEAGPTAENLVVKVSVRPAMGIFQLRMSVAAGGVDTFSHHARFLISATTTMMLGSFLYHTK